MREVPFPTAATSKPSFGEKLLGSFKTQRHGALAEPGAVSIKYILHDVTEGTKGPPYTFGRVDAWWFRVSCHFPT